MLFDISKADIEEIHDDLFSEKQVGVSVLRLDKIHPLVSGNKIFKLHYFLEEARGSTHKTILSFGGAYSNHLAATAYACKASGLSSIGIVRGEAPTRLSPTLQQCVEDGMLLQFVSRTEYDVKETIEFNNKLKTQFGEFMLVPEGGFHPLGAKGAALIYHLIPGKKYTHIALATGTATTLAGMLRAADADQQVISIPVLKGITDNKERIKQLNGVDAEYKNLEILSDYHFGGYAKKTTFLTDFMNLCHQRYRLQLDFVYTAKMFFAITDRIKNDGFKKGSQILCLHTGGLQGNKSLPLNTLLF
ncbi:MAG: pyridoxal-phosphate dependent enzyme [Ferruginibacter sp.]